MEGGLYDAGDSSSRTLIADSALANNSAGGQTLYSARLGRWAAPALCRRGHDSERDDQREPCLRWRWGLSLATSVRGFNSTIANSRADGFWKYRPR